MNYNYIFQYGIDLKCFPLCFNSSLTEKDINKQECSDGIYLSSDRFSYFNNTDSEELVILKITKGNLSTYAQIVGIHSENRNMVLMPSWMVEYLNVDYDEQVLLERCMDVNIGLHIRIKPHSTKYASLNDPVSSLRNAFENYIVLQPNMDIPLLVDGERLIVSIMDTFSKGPICIRGVELEVEIENPTDYKIQKEEAFDFSNMLPMPPVENKQFQGKGYILGSKIKR